MQIKVFLGRNGKGLIDPSAPGGVDIGLIEGQTLLSIAYAGGGSSADGIFSRYVIEGGCFAQLSINDFSSTLFIALFSDPAA
jgi:hypothetical protein